MLEKSKCKALFLKMEDAANGVTGVGIVCVCCLEAFESKRPRNARANLEIGFKTQKMASFEVFLVILCSWCFRGLRMHGVCGK